MHGSWEPFHHGGFPRTRSILGLQSRVTCSPRPFAPPPFLLPLKTTAGPAAPSGEPRAVWEGWMHPAAASS